MAGGLVCSYAVISLSVLCSAPALRKWLTRLNERRGSDRFAPSFLLVNGGLLAVCIIAICASYPAGRANGESFKYLHEAYTGAQALIARARTEQNLALMASFQAYVDLFGKISLVKLSSRLKLTLCNGCDLR